MTTSPMGLRFPGIGFPQHSPIVACDLQSTPELLVEVEKTWKVQQLGSDVGIFWEGCNFQGWWFQQIWKILVKMETFPQVGMKTKNIRNHHLVQGCWYLWIWKKNKKSTSKSLPINRLGPGCLVFLIPGRVIVDLCISGESTFTLWENWNQYS